MPEYVGRDQEGNIVQWGVVDGSSPKKNPSIKKDTIFGPSLSLKT
jgi:hypothetical protein